MTSQLTLLAPDSFPDLDVGSGQANHGEVFTRRWVVEFILDLVGYRADADLGSTVVVEPSCGTGAFLIPIVDRLVESCERHGRDIETAVDAIRAFDLLEDSAEVARKGVAQRLSEHGVDVEAAERLADGWITTADFLLSDHEPRSANFVVGNPPYVRLEEVPRQLTEAYRRAWPTMRGRSDIYIGFFEAGLRLLGPDGVLGYICADRWMHNQYGGALRELITDQYAVDTIVSMHDVDAFEDEVSAYPAVVVLRSGDQKDVNLIETQAAFDPRDAETVRGWVGGETPSMNGAAVQGTQLTSWFTGSSSWPGGNPARRALVADLESRFPPLESAVTGTRVGIGVATGCDDVYITSDPELVESDRLLPLLLARDTTSGTAQWSGHYLINPWNGHGLVNLADYPRLRAYFDQHAGRLRGRHVAKRRPQAWYRTIDKVDPQLRSKGKLLLPDIKAASNPVLDTGDHYPHHNLYFVVSDAWGLEVLGGLLLSDVANAIIGSYCVKMRGGYYRFQAQYVRRMRVPELDELDQSIALGLVDAFRSRDREAATELAAQVYGIDRSLLREALEL